MPNDYSANKRKVYLPDRHLRIVEQVAQTEGFTRISHHFSATVQHIVDDYAERHGITAGTDETPAAAQEAA